MKTNYGELPIVITNGTARMIKGDGKQTVTRAPSRQGQQTGGLAPYDSKLEAKRGQFLLMLRLAGEIKRVTHHPFTITIGPRRRYTPDFLIEYPDGRLVVEEVKGSVQQKNARDSITRLHVAAGQLPMFRWRLVVGEAMEERDVEP